MPNLEEHCRRTLKRYGVEGRDIHAWLDEPSRQYATAHRQFRHDTETIRLAGEIFGKVYGKSLAENIALDHIMIDHEEEIKRRNTTIVVNLPEKREIPAIPCSYCNTLLKPSDQLCPKCGASRTKIIEQFDRAYELEKLKLQKKKKELKEELEIELEYKEMPPLQRLHMLKGHRELASKIGNRLPSIVKSTEILERLVQEDLRNDPELEKKYESELKIRNQIMEEEKLRKARRNAVKLLAFFLVILFPAIYLGSTVHPLLGIFWFVFGSIFVLVA